MRSTSSADDQERARPTAAPRENDSTTPSVMQRAVMQPGDDAQDQPSARR